MAIGNLNIFLKKKRNFLILGKKKINGKNYNATTVLHRGGAAKRKFIIIDYSRYIWNVTGIILQHLYDPHKRMLVNLVSYINGILSYSLAVNGLIVGDVIINGLGRKSNNLGSTTYVFNITSGSLVTLLEFGINKGASVCRAAGMFSKVYTRMFSQTAVFKIKSKKKFIVSSFCLATIGILNVLWHKRYALHKAGYTRHRGWRPHVRGYAMNPVDHPHGGRTKSGIKVSLWGKDTKGHRTRKRKGLFEIYLKR